MIDPGSPASMHDQRLYRSDVGDVDSDGVGRAAALADRRGRRLDLRTRARGEQHVCTSLCERRRHGKPAAAPGTCNQRAAPLQPEAGRRRQLHRAQSRSTAL
jgi:hypothetical protein